MWVTLHLWISKFSVCKNHRTGLPWRLSCEESTHQCRRHRFSSEPERSRTPRSLSIRSPQRLRLRLESASCNRGAREPQSPAPQRERLRNQKPVQGIWRGALLATAREKLTATKTQHSQKQLRKVLYIYICKESPEKAMWVLEPY